jgi:hypothetical protein
MHLFLVQGEALTPAQVAAEESLVAPPLQSLIRGLGLGFSGTTQVALAPRLLSLVSRGGQVDPLSIQIQHLCHMLAQTILPALPAQLQHTNAC